MLPCNDIVISFDHAVDGQVALGYVCFRYAASVLETGRCSVAHKGL